VAIDEMFDQTGLEPSWIDVVACDVGPGSFTGVRVGLAGAKGIALACDVPLVPVVSLAAMAAAAFEQADSSSRRIAAALDAKRGEIFFAVYERDGSVIHAPASVSRGSLASVVGDVPCCGQAAADELGSERRLICVESALPHGRWIANLALVQPPSDIDAVEPVYARAPDAIKPTAPPKLSRA